jgi:hypothetical protein
VANRIIALAGKGKGPVVYTGNLGHARAKIVGMKDGHVVVRAGFTNCFDDECAMLYADKDGMFAVGEFPFMQAEYHGESFMVCTLHAG